MFNKIEKILKSKLFTNTSWLFILQIFNSVIPMLTLPYITRILGPIGYGEFSLALNVIMYMQVLVEFGFGLSGARKVSMAKEQKEISNLFSAILFNRIFLCAIDVIILLVIFKLNYFSESAKYCAIVLFIIILGVIIQPIWLFQGKQDMKIITITNVIGRTISTILIFIFVKQPDHIYLYCILYSCSTLISNIIGTCICFKKYNIKIVWNGINKQWEELKSGWYLFLSVAMSKIVGNLGVTILGIYCAEYYVGIYSAIIKIPNILLMFVLPITQSIYPIVSKKFVQNSKSALNFIFNIGSIVVGGCICIATFILIFRNYFINLVFGTEYSAFGNLLFPFFLWLILSITNNFLGIQCLVANGYEREYSKCFQISVLTMVVGNLVMARLFGMYGVAWATMFAELILSLVLLIKIKKIYY